ncbi:hypothetical protein [Bifidobacterium biavatii]|uniref:Uncharacterized protein n=1 Tax=Bifidobacterium biavatii DSM 23969 TaxID=1437608 RepID=A0A087A111_9BIFI|nr:hypothetical protein [Bifidobacterium biavatii]KFI52461.1 hypothetical protein BBIA_0885 [Bifidobacterium biavatii DSM 23969]
MDHRTKSDGPVIVISEKDWREYEKHVDEAHADLKRLDDALAALKEQGGKTAGDSSDDEAKAE